VRDARDLLDRQPRPVAVANRRDRDDRGLLVDRLVKALERDLHAVRRDVDDSRTAQLLRVPDLADRRELEVADHHLRARAELDRTRERTDAGRERGRHRDVVCCAVDEPRE